MGDTKRLPIKYMGDNYVIVQCAAKREKSEGGIVIPDAAQEAVTEGVCVAWDDDCNDEAVGETVVFLPNRGTEMTICGEKVRVLHIDDVVCTY